MSKENIIMTPELNHYVSEISLRETDVLKKLRVYTSSLQESNMQIAPEQGQYMALLARLIGAKNYIEVGVFTGYSTLAVALALPQDGSIIACDVSEEWTSIAQMFWREANVMDKIDLRLAPAADTLKSLVSDGRINTFDLAFIDADKSSYSEYFELCLQLIRPGGLILIDNVLWNGDVVNPEDQSRDTVAIREFNRNLHMDERVELSVLPLADGLTLALKR